MDINQELNEIKERNKRVEIDKAWEGSFMRRGFLIVITYVVATAWLRVIHEPDVFLKAFVPVAGYVISTLTLPPLKRWWTHRTFEIKK